METIARYTEEKIKTYEFHTKLDLCICEFSLELERFGQIEHEMGEYFSDLILFDLFLMGPSDERQCHFSVVVPDRKKNHVKTFLGEMNPQFAGIKLRFTTPVELLYFYGPHFGDRYGIADYTFNALSQCKIPLIASACSGASIYLVLPENYALKAKTAFSNLFEIPKTVQPKPSWVHINRQTHSKKDKNSDER